MVDFHCPHCDHEFTYEIIVNSIIRPADKKVTAIGSNDPLIWRERLRQLNAFFRGPTGYVPFDPNELVKLNSERVELRKKLGLPENA